MQRFDKTIKFTVLVAALGYFVDIYDLLLFGIVRMPSLRSMGVPEDQMMKVGVHLLNMQMVGMLIGGIVWGITGDKRGRKSVLFGSILLYSLCNIANAFVVNPDVYAWLRFFAGIGLAGELGAAVTLVSEIMHKDARGTGTAIVASVGILGAVLASLIGDYFSWQTAYLVGGGMGLCLLALRAGILESHLFSEMDEKVRKGNFLQLLSQPSHWVRYLSCIVIGIPIWFVIGILITFSPELTRELGVTGTVTASRAILWTYMASSVGDLSAGLLSQRLRSRKQSVLIFLCMTAVLFFVYVHLPPVSNVMFYCLCGALGFGVGYWAVFVTVAAEQFGTNIRATVATTVPNFVRGSVVPLTLAVETLRGRVGIINAVQIVGVLSLCLAFAGLYFLRETYGQDLNYTEKH